MKRTADSTASCFDFNSNCAYPPTTSLASLKGPSVTVTFPPESRTRAPSAVGPSPPPPIMVPAWAASSLSFAMASISALGGGPDLSADLTIIMNRIFRSPFSFALGAEFPDDFGRRNPGSIYTSNEGQQNRHPVSLFWKYLVGVGNDLT